MQPRMPLAFWAASAHCQLIFSFSSTNTPKSRAACNPLIPQAVSMFGFVPTQVQVLALGLDELYDAGS